jgi:hypothetical protein
MSLRAWVRAMGGGVLIGLVALGVVAVAALVDLDPTETFEYTSPADAVRAEWNRYRHLPAIVPASATKIRQVYDYDSSAQWVSFAAPDSTRRRLGASLRPVSTTEALERLPFVRGRHRAEWPVGLRRNTARVEERIGRYRVYQTDEYDVMAAMEDGSDLVHVWTSPPISRGRAFRTGPLPPDARVLTWEFGDTVAVEGVASLTDSITLVWTSRDVGKPSFVQRRWREHRGDVPGLALHFVNGGPHDLVLTRNGARVGGALYIAGDTGYAREAVPFSSACAPPQLREVDGDGRADFIAFELEPGEAPLANTLARCRLRCNYAHNNAWETIHVQQPDGSFAQDPKRTEPYYRSLAARYEKAASTLEAEYARNAVHNLEPCDAESVALLRRHRDRALALGGGR